MNGPFLLGLNAETRAEIEKAGIERDWPRNGCLFRNGEECAGMHVVLDGLIKLFRASGGKEQIVLLEGTGGVLALTPVLDGGRHLVTAEALTKARTLFVDTPTLLRIMEERVDLREAVMVEMARRFRMVVGLLETVSLKTVSARVATRVLEVASARDALDGSRSFKLFLSQDELARVLATSRESIARALADFRTAGVIEQRGATIRILDPERLFMLAGATSGEPATPVPMSVH